MTDYIIEKEYVGRWKILTWCKNNNIDHKIEYIYYTNVIPERIRISFENDEDFVLFKLTWE